VKKLIEELDRERGVYRVTTVDERHYARPAIDPDTGLPAYEFIPSVTWISGYYPKGVGFYKWLANTGWDESQALREAAADKGSKVHQACAALIDGKTLAMESEFINPSSGQAEPLAVEEWQCLMAFRDWWAAARPTTLLRDIVVWGDGYAGTLDWVGTLPEEDGARALWLLDFKTGASVWPEHRLQVSAYKHALLGDPPAMLTGPFIPGGLPFLRLGVLQLGYRQNQRGWKLTEVEDCYPLFEAARAIWAAECDGEKPTQREYPLELTLAHGPAPAPKAKRGRKAKAETA
jgi:hypothetical protein